MATVNDQSDSAQSPDHETETGLDANVAAALSYVLGFITGIIMFLIETENDHVRFHAAQSIVVFGFLFVLSMAMSFFQVIAGFSSIIGFFVGTVISLLSLLVTLGGFILWIYLIVRSYQNENPRIPGAAGIADGLV